MRGLAQPFANGLFCGDGDGTHTSFRAELLRPINLFGQCFCSMLSCKDLRCLGRCTQPSRQFPIALFRSGAIHELVYRCPSENIEVVCVRMFLARHLLPIRVRGILMLEVTKLFVVEMLKGFMVLLKSFLSQYKNIAMQKITEPTI